MPKVLNEYPTQKLRVNSTLLQLCADGVLFGATAPCEVCKARCKYHRPARPVVVVASSIYTIREIGGTITVYTVLFVMLSTISSSGTVIAVLLYCSAIIAIMLYYSFVVICSNIILYNTLHKLEGSI